jgi:hypothetical protein
MASAQAIQASGEGMAQVFRAAMLAKTALRVAYDGRDRVVCPQMLGRSRDGRVRILCLQIAGDSVTGLREGQGDWRCLALEKCSHAEPTEGVWRTASSSPRLPNCIAQVELEVGVGRSAPQWPQ